jgi:hypothetical protein
MGATLRDETNIAAVVTELIDAVPETYFGIINANAVRPNEAKVGFAGHLGNSSLQSDPFFAIRFCES